MQLLQRIVISFLCLLFSALNVVAQSGFVLERESWSGAVRSIRIENAEALIRDGKLVELHRRPHQLITYNEKKQETERVNFKEDGSIESHSVNRYDSEGRHIGSGDANEEGKKDPYHSVLAYDSKGNLTETHIYKGDVLEEQSVYTYDDKGRKLEEVRIADNGAHRTRIAYKYNSAGQQIEMAAYFNEALDSGFLKAYDNAGNLVKEISISNLFPPVSATAEYVYDSQGRQIEVRTNDKILWSKVQTSYDTKGRITERETFMGYKSPNIWRSHAPEPGKEVFRYNERGQVNEELFYTSDGALIRKATSTYNASGKLIERLNSTRDNPDAGKMTYEYDSHGNKIKQTIFTTDWQGQPYVYITYYLINYQ